MDVDEVFEELSDGQEIDLYGEFPELYDFVYGAMSSGEKSRHARRNIPEDARVLDVACGTGIVTAELEGLDVVGTDINREMLETADGKLDRSPVQADMRSLPFEAEFDAVIMYGQPLSHLPDTSDVQAAAQSVYESLEEGVFVTEVFSTDILM